MQHYYVIIKKGGGVSAFLLVGALQSLHLPAQLVVFVGARLHPVVKQ